MLHMLIPGLCYKVALLVARLSGGTFVEKHSKVYCIFSLSANYPEGLCVMSISRRFSPLLLK